MAGKRSSDRIRAAASKGKVKAASPALIPRGNIKTGDKGKTAGVITRGAGKGRAARLI